jgi:DNA helicase-2/ATP-dependent DNA helicase PcrA
MTIQWDRYQRAVFDELRAGNDNLVVLARAGSGKTSTLVEGLKFIPPYADTLLCAFNKDIQRELRRRAPGHVKVQTMHSLGFRTLRERLRTVEVEEKKGFMIAGKVAAKHRATLSRQLEKDIVRAGEKGNPLRDLPKLLRKLTSICKQTHVRGLEDIERNAHVFQLTTSVLRAPLLAPLVVECMQEATRLRSCVDYDDMLYLPAKLGLPPTPNSFVFVDETQDLNAAQLWLAQKACLATGRIVAIGDPKQAIYGWRGADRRAIPRMIEQLSAKTLPLSVTYRCPVAVVEHVKRAVGGLDDLLARPGAPQGICEVLDWAQFTGPEGPRPGDFVLSRLNAPLMPVALSFLAHGKPCVVAGRNMAGNMLDLIKRSASSEIFDLLAYLEEYRRTERERLLQEDALEHYETIEDQCLALACVAKQCRTISELTERIDALFSEKTTTDAIVCSTVHKAKGLERGRVFMLRNTFRLGTTTEEENIYYVAATRAMRELYLVEMPSN